MTSWIDDRAIIEFFHRNSRIIPVPGRGWDNFDFGIDLNDPTTLAQLDDTEDAVAFVKEKEQGELADKVCRNCFLCDIRLTEISGDLSLFLGLFLEDPEVLRNRS